MSMAARPGRASERTASATEVQRRRDAGRGTAVGVAIAVLLLLAIHLLTLYEGPRWSSPLLIGDWLFTGTLAMAVLVYALAIGRKVARPLLLRDDDRLTASLVALGLGLGTLSVSILLLGFVRLYYAPVFLGLVVALTVWLRVELRTMWRQTTAGIAWWFRSGQPSAPTRGQRLVLLVLVLTFLSVLLRAMLPVTEWDAVIYHLAGPKLYIAAHNIIPLPDLPLANAPSGEEMLFIPALYAGSDGIGKVLDVLFALLLGLATYNFGRRHLDPATAWLGVLLLFSSIWLQLVIPLTLTDFATAFLTVLGVSDICAWVRGYASRAGVADTSAATPVHGHRPELAVPGTPRRRQSPYTAMRAQMAGGEQDASQAKRFRWWRAPAITNDDRLLVRGSLLVGLSISFKLTNAPAAPASLVTIGLATLAATLVAHHGRDGGGALAVPIRALWYASLVALRNTAIAGIAILVPLSPWLLKNLYFFGHALYPLGIQVSNPSHGIDIAAAAPSPLAHLQWIATTFGSLLWDHMGALSLLLLLAPFVLRRPAQRAAQLFFVVGCLLWLLYVPFFEPPRYYIGLVAIGQALTAGTVGYLMQRLGRPRLVEVALVVYLLVRGMQGLFVGATFVTDPLLQKVALGTISRQDYLATHLPAYTAEDYANTHLPAGAEVALVNVVSGYYMDRPHIDEWYGTTLSALESSASTRRVVLARWCRMGVRYAVFDRGSGNLDDNDRTSVRPPSAFVWLATPGLRPHVLYSAKGVDVLAVRPCAAGR